MTTPRDSQRSKFLRAWRDTKTQYPATFSNDKQMLHWLRKLQGITRNERGGIEVDAAERDRWSMIYWLATESGPVDEALHGREAARLALRLVQSCIGRDAARDLREAFKREGVKYRATPTLTPEERERRAAQGRRLADRKADQMLAEHREVIKQRLGIS